MDDVYLEGATPEGPAVVGHLSVIVDSEGITFLGPEPGERRMVGWERSSPLEFGAPAALPDGEQGTCLEFVVDGRPLRLLVPSKKGAHDAPAGSGDVPPASDPPTRPAHLAEPPLFIDPPAPVVADAPALLLEPPAPTPVDPIETVLATPPAPTFLDPPAPTVLDPPAPTVLDPPAPTLRQPPAPAPMPVPLPVSDPVGPPAPDVVDDIALVAATTHDGAGTDTAVDPAADEDESGPVRLPAWFRYVSRQSRESKKHAPTRAERIVRLVVFTVLAGLIPIAAGVRYFQDQGTTGHITGVALTDAAVAARVGIQPTDLPGWSAGAPQIGNAFAAGATTHGAAALNTAEQASTVLARCLHVPVSAVDGAFGMGNSVSQRTAEAISPSYADPAGNGGAVSSVVDVVKSPQIGATDATVFQDPALFATCYQPFVQAMLPYASGGGPTGFATATVQPVVVPVPAGPGTVTVAGFQIARIANEAGQTKTVVSIATAVFVGRVQATLGTVSNLVFSLDAQNQLVRHLEIRSIGVGQL
jgi:hypothetical protein